ncbi:peptide synthetase [Vibrio fluvialis]|uniref:condensation domain-containing protein n=1 Tax=Vibrio fluvialis TaxID=676 RepID=UPI001C9BD910|nr:condensation domain-containing protein [Vibrio fluvialis]MBY7804786.1 peptide synthetase [Vibrio fluvialis]MBY7846908.1 peptide synthetase [Vibrio fluvialis]MBY7907667.1 peptide synthetase [Vibrio fluvialis]MBY7932323.1 peptide synthetase [Vibrio fluvialis]MBY8093074.1 peptide synthetase [Vibrio fluvialis]
MSEYHSFAPQRPADSAAPPHQLSEFEQQVWLHHEQCGDSSHQWLSAFRLSGDVHLSLLLEALESMLQSLPDLNVRYQLNDEFELIKLFSTSPGQRVELVQVADRTEAVQHLLNWQNERIDLAFEPPMQFRLLLGDELILAARHHRILAHNINWQTLLNSLSSFYQGELNAEAWTQSHQTELPLAHPLYSREQPLNSAYLWLAAGESSARSSIEWLGSERIKSTQRRAEKVRASLPVHALTQLTEHKGAQASLDHGVMLCAAVTEFARFIARLSGKTQQTVFAPKQVVQRHHELNGSAVQSGLLRLTLDTANQPRKTLFDNVENQWRAGESNACGLANPDDLAILVTWSVDPAVHLRLGKVQTETVRLAPLHCDFDLVLALGISCDNKLLLELTTGERLSPYIAGWLLEQFTASFGDDRVMPSIEAPVISVADDAHPQRGERERIAALIAEAFGAALNHADFSIHDDFFDFGGHSLIATRVIGQLKTDHQVEVHINDLFSQPTAWGLAEHAISHSNSLPVQAQNEVQPMRHHAPLSFAQASLWKAYAAFGYNELFNIPFALRFLDPVDETLFGLAFEDVMRRHSVLRTRFVTEGDTVEQHVVPEAELSQYRWFWRSEDTGNVERQTALNQEASHVFDLSRELPVRLRFVRDPNSGLQYLSFLFHHVVLDEWSVNVLMDDLREAYQARALRTTPQWRAQPLPFSEYAARQHERGFDESHLAYWLKQFEGVPLDAPLLPELQNQPDAEPSDAGGWMEFKLDTNVALGLNQLARQQGASLFNVVYAAISLALKKLGAPSQLIVGTPASGRLDAEFFDTVGYFTTLAMHVVHFDRAESVAELIAQVKNTINESLDYSDVPIDWVEDALLGARTDKHHLFEVMIQLHAKNKLHGELMSAQQAVRFEQVDPEKSESALGLQFEVMEERVGGEDRVRVLMSYRSDQYGDTQVKTLTETTQRMLARFAEPNAEQTLLCELVNA